jgi:hypothetical protein
LASQGFSFGCCAGRTTRWTIAIDDIKSIRKPNGFFRGGRSSPALSMDRLEITYGPNKRMMISPENQEQFLADLKSRQ